MSLIVSMTHFLSQIYEKCKIYTQNKEIIAILKFIVRRTKAVYKILWLQLVSTIVLNTNYLRFRKVFRTFGKKLFLATGPSL